MSFMKCCVPGCSAEETTGFLHTFPNPGKDLERFKSWIFNIGGEILQLRNKYIYKNRRVFHSHFEEKYCCRFNRISNIAVPTVNMPATTFKFGFANSKEPLRQTQNLPASGPSAPKDEGVLVWPEKMIQHLSNEKESSIELLSKIQNVPAHGPSVPKDEDLLVGPETIMQHNLVEKEIEDHVPDLQNKQPASNRKRKAKVMDDDKDQANTKRGNVKVSIRTKRKLAKYKNKMTKQARELKSAKNIYSNPAFVKVMENLPKSAKVLTQLQFREQTKKEKGRRFLLKEKNIALTILKQSPKSYRFLGKIFVLPSPQTLLKLLANANIQPGVNKKIFAQMQEKTTQMKTSEKLCILFKNIKCNKHKDKLLTFLMNKVTRFFIYTYCKNINKVLSGKKGMDDINDKFEKMAYNYYKKYHTKK